METSSESPFTAEENLIATNLLLKTKLEVELNILVGDDLPFSIVDQNHLLRYLHAVETVMANVPRGTIQDFIMGQFYSRINEKW